jgi:hypothetical protein
LHLRLRSRNQRGDAVHGLCDAGGFVPPGVSEASWSDGQRRESVAPARTCYLLALAAPKADLSSEGFALAAVRSRPAKFAQPLRNFAFPSFNSSADVL